MNWTMTALKIAALVVLAVVAFVVNALVSSEFAGRLFPLVRPRPYFEMISAEIVGSLAAGLVIAYPLVRMFPRRYWVAGLLTALPYMDLRVEWLVMYIGKDEPRIMTTAAFELLFYPTAIVFCAWAYKKYFVGSRKDSSATTTTPD